MEEEKKALFSLVFVAVFAIGGVLLLLLSHGTTNKAGEVGGQGVPCDCSQQWCTGCYIGDDWEYCPPCPWNGNCFCAGTQTVCDDDSDCRHMNYQSVSWGELKHLWE